MTVTQSEISGAVTAHDSREGFYVTHILSVVTLKPMKFKSMENKANQCTHFHIMRQKSHMQTSSKNSKNMAAIKGTAYGKLLYNNKLLYNGPMS